MVGGGSISEPHLRELRDLLPGTFVFQCYGQTEVAGQLTLFKTKDVRESLLLYYKPNSAGTPVPGMTYRVIPLNNYSITTLINKIYCSRTEKLLVSTISFSWGVIEKIVLYIALFNFRLSILKVVILVEHTSKEN